MVSRCTIVGVMPVLFRDDHAVADDDLLSSFVGGHALDLGICGLAVYGAALVNNLALLGFLLSLSCLLTPLALRLAFLARGLSLDKYEGTAFFLCANKKGKTIVVGIKETVPFSGCSWILNFLARM